jgi:hypothetical protein
MKNTILVQLVVLICLIALSAGCVDYILGTLEETACDNVDPSTVNEGWDRSHCFKDAAERKNTPETCKKIEESAPKTKCYMELAEELGQWQLCNNLADKPSGQDYSRLECLYRTAVATGDQVICEHMGDATYGSFFSRTYNKEECLKAVKSSPKNYEGGTYDPKDTESGNGGTF